MGSGRFRLRSCFKVTEVCDEGAGGGIDLEEPVTVRLLATLVDEEVSVDLNALI